MLRGSHKAPAVGVAGQVDNLTSTEVQILTPEGSVTAPAVGDAVRVDHLNSTNVQILISKALHRIPYCSYKAPAVGDAVRVDHLPGEFKRYNGRTGVIESVEFDASFRQWITVMLEDRCVCESYTHTHIHIHTHTYIYICITYYI